MSIFTRFTLRSLAKNRVRTAVTVVGITLSCALVCAIATSVTSLQAALLTRALETEGAWQGYASLATDAAGGALEKLGADDRVTDVALSRELGSALTGQADATQYGGSVALVTLPATEKGAATPGGYALVPLPEIASGRMPEKPGEVMLPEYLEGVELGAADADAGVRSAGALELGGVITLDLGRFERTDGDGVETISNLEAVSELSFAETGSDEGRATSIRLADTRAVTLTVTGFYETQPGFSGTFTSLGSGTAAGIVSADTTLERLGTAGAAASGNALPSFTRAWIATQGLATTNAISGVLLDAGAGDCALNTGLTRYQGIYTEGAVIYDTLWLFAGILAAIVLAASVSLIYSSFAISVAERTRQFGLLSSLGASRRQLRRTVLAEALLLGAAAVPAGVALGVGGTAVVLGLTGNVFASALSLTGGVPLAVSPVVLAACAVICLAALVVSAWVPARRAGHVSAVDAIRQTQDVRLSRRALRVARREARRAERAAARAAEKRAANAGASRPAGLEGAGAAAGAPVVPAPKLGLAGRLFGVPGFIAHRNLARSSARGRTVVASLAVSVVLLVSTGAVALYLEPLADRAELKGGGTADVIANVMADRSNPANNRELSNLTGDFAAFVSEAQRMPGATLRTVVRQGQAEAVIPAGLLTDAACDAIREQQQTQAADWVPRRLQADGSYVGDAAIFYVDDATWNQMLDELGLDARAFTDPAHPRAIAVNKYQGNTAEGQYIDLAPFAQTGAVDLYATRGYKGQSRMGLMVGRDDELVAGYIDNTADGPVDDAGNPVIQEKPLAEATVHEQVEVGALCGDLPDALVSIGASAHLPALVLPAGILPVGGNAGTDDDPDVYTYSFATLQFSAEDHAAAAEALQQIADDHNELMSVSVLDAAATAEEMRSLVRAMQLFVGCFSVVTALVAVANVFNTLTTNIILRTREFAVLKSVGMGGRAFARMLVYECASYAVRSLLAGLALACGVTFALYHAVRLSFAGISFTVPWGSVAAGFALVLVILALSVAYALKRSHAQNIVEALRADAL